MASAAVIVIGVGAISAPASADEEGGYNSCIGFSCNDVEINDSGNTITRTNNDFESRGRNNTNVVGNDNVVGGDTTVNGGIRVQGADAKASSSSNSGGNSFTVEGDEAPDIPVSTAYAAPLTSAEDTCMGSTSMG
ncbi:hypothetical protein LCGC14_2975790, partial [marine sediment metagenome]